MDYAKLDALIEARRDEFLKDLGRWLSVPSVQGAAEEGAPFGRENRRMLDLALEDARGYGFATRMFDGYAGDISMGAGEKTLGILCHLDVVPAGDGWTVEPFALTQKDGNLIGRGVLDDKGPALAALYAMRCVRDAGVELKDTVRLILGCDEETGMTDMAYYNAHTAAPDYGFSPDAEYPVINIEKGGLHVLLSKNTGGEEGAEIPVYELYAGERPNVVPGIARAVVGCKDVSTLRARLELVAAARGFELALRDLGDGRAEITATGKSAHASTPHLGRNAAGMLLIALSELGAGGGSREAIQTLAACLGISGQGKLLGIAVMDELSGPLTCNLGILRYDGEHFNAHLDIRYPLNASEEKICGQICMKVSPAQIAATRLSGHAPHHVPADHKVVKGLLKAYSDVTGHEGYAFAIGGGTYSRCMPNTVAFGPCFPGDVDTCHMPDEWFSLENMMLSIRIMAHAIAELAGKAD
ncbi:MAG TPA: dipeptidase PepV [Candidatus Pullichristensenella avicola]|nr:dipeptidase PepV [Candidatus Pullichristensenella avicola]